MTCDLLIKNIRGLVQVRERPVSRLCGDEMADLPILSDAYLAVKDGLIQDFGQTKNLPAVNAIQTIDASGRFVFPSFVDSHTHLVFAASREEEFVMKIKGLSYQEIAAKGGGILNSAKKVQRASEEELLHFTRNRVHQIIATGTGAVEIKSGYGLTVKDELKMLRVARKIGELTPLTVKTTLLGAHAVPAGMTRADYVNVVIDEMIPAAASEKLADYVDVFCEQGFFDQQDTERIAETGKRFGLLPRIHANQLTRSGGVQAGVRVGAISVDHLENIGEDEIELLKGSKVMPTLLPGAAFFLGLPFPPVRNMLQSGLPVAIASDYNPGSSPSGNMSMMVSLSCIKMKMTPEEAFNACTINSASAMGLSESHGSITRGKKANLFITSPIPSIAYMPYAYGTQLVDTVVLNGKIFSPTE